MHNLKEEFEKFQSLYLKNLNVVNNLNWNDASNNEFKNYLNSLNESYFNNPAEH